MGTVKAKSFAHNHRILFQLALISFIIHTASGQASALKQPPETVNVGAIIAWETTAGKVAKSAIELAIEDVNSNTNVLKGTQLHVDIRDSRSDAVEGASAALDLLRNETVAIVGPQTSVVAEFVAYMGDRARVPIVTFAATDPSLSMHRYPYFLRTSHGDSLQMQAIAAVIQNLGWREVVVIYVDDDFGTGALPSLNDALRDVQAKIVHRAPISPQADAKAIQELLSKLKTLQSRVFVTHIHPDAGSRFFSEAKKMGMMDNEYVWIITDGLASNLDCLDSSALMTMQGVLGIKTYIPKSKRLQEFATRWKKRFRAEDHSTELSVYGLKAYDTVWAIAYALEKFLRSETIKFLQSAAGNGNSTDLLDLNIFKGGHLLKEKLLQTQFEGLSGLVNISEKGEPLNSIYDIVNVAGKRYNVVGSWTQQGDLGMSSDVETLGRNTLKLYIETIVWPGGSEKVPRGWMKPIDGKKLRIGVPWEHGFQQFISVTQDAHNRTNVSGFCIDVFEAVLKRLDYDLPHEYIPYGTGNVTSGYYDDLVYQVNLGHFDAVVGDVAVLANRSKYVDFTQPYTETGLVMTVRIDKDESSDPWAFLRPFTPGMWFTTCGFFFFTGAAVWLLEHRRNKHFRGKPRKQVLTFLWFSFSTVFFTHREKVVSSLGRMVLIIWLFVVLVLVSSYTASLSSMLTVKQIVPEVQNVQSLINGKLPIGYRQGSFVGTYLEEQLGVDKSLLVPLSTVQEYAEALKRGPKSGGVAAVFEEQASAFNLLLPTHCEYTTVGPTYRTGGYSFVFPKGSPLVSDISRAVLNLSESKDMQRIRDQWFKISKSCNTEGSRVDSNRLNLKNFWGVFLITGSVSLLALVFYFCRLVYRFARNLPDHTEEDGPSVNSISRRLQLFADYADRRETPLPKSKRSRQTAVMTYEADASSSPLSVV
eukprot:Gb_20613 [translate_table: standard]